MSKPKAYGFWSHPIYYTKKGAANVKNEFKPGDLVFEVSHGEGVFLTRLSETVQDTYEIRGQVMCYLHDGRYSTCAVLPLLFHATPEMREKLVAIWGEDAVPELPLRGSELTRKLLEKQKYVICFCSDTNDDDCRENKRPVLIRYFKEGYFYNRDVDSPYADTWKHAVPIDNNGDEITEIESC